MIIIYENIKKFNPHFKIEDWCFQELKRVDLNKIIGTTHESYIGRMWADLPYAMKRFYDYYNVDNCLDFSKSNNFYKNDIGYEKYGDFYFIAGGNHRTCQAKFSNLTHVITDVTEYIFDFQMYNSLNSLINEGLQLLIKASNDGKYYRFSLWKINLNSKEYYFQSYAAIEKFIKYYNQFLPSYINFIVAKFSKKEILTSYNEDKDYSYLKNAIILHKRNKNINHPFSHP